MEQEASPEGQAPIKKSFITLLDGEADDLSSEHSTSSASSEKSVNVLELDDNDVKRSPFFEQDQTLIIIRSSHQNLKRGKT